MQRGRRMRLEKSAFVIFLLVVSTFLLASPSTGGGSQSAPAQPNKRLWLTNTTYSSAFMVPGPYLGNAGYLEAPPKSSGTTVAWEGTPISQNGYYGSTVFSFAKLDPTTGSPKAKNITATPGYENGLLAQELRDFYQNPIFDGGYVITGQTSASNSSQLSLYAYNTADGTSRRASLDRLGRAEFGGVEYETPLSSSGGQVLGIFNKVGLNPTYEYDSNYNLVPQSVDVDYIGVLSGNTFQQVSPDDHSVMSTGCSYYSNGQPHPYSVLFDPTVPDSVVAGGNGRYAYGQGAFSLDRLGSGDCQPVTYGTSYKVYLNDGTVVQAFNPATTNESKGYMTCMDVGPCFSGFIGFWNNLLLYQTCYSIACSTGGPFNYTIYDLRSHSGTAVNVPIAPEWMQTDGSDMAWTGTDGLIYLYHQSTGVRRLTSTPFPTDLEFYATGVRLSNGWVSWLNSTGFLNFYEISSGKLSFISAAPDADPSSFVSSKGFVEPMLDFGNAREAWVVNEDDGQVLYVYSLNSAAGVQAKVSVDLGWSTIVNDLVVSGNWIYLQAVPEGGTVNQIFAVQPPGLTPVILIPGIAATQLTSGKNQVWLGAKIPSYATGTSSVAKVALCGFSCGDRYDLLQNSVGSSTVPIGVGRILDFNLLKVLSETNAYGALEESLESLGYVNGSTLFLFGYDWRLDNALHFPELDSLISRVQDTTGSHQVILVAHSMGGVISRGYLLSSQERALKVQALITIDTPYWGAPKAYYALVDGYGFGNPTADQVTMKVIAQNATAAYELTPRIPFVLNLTAFKAVYPYNDPYKITSVFDICTYTPSACVSVTSSLSDISYKGFEVTYSSGTPGTILLAQGHNPERQGAAIVSIIPSWKVTWSPNRNILNTALAYSRGWGNFTSPASHQVPTYALIGDGYQTLDGYVMQPATAAQISAGQYVVFKGSKVVMVPHFSDGDGTVPLRSEELNAEGVHPLYFRYSGGDQTAHVPMAFNPQALAVITGIFNGVAPSKLCQNGKLCTSNYTPGSLGQTSDKEYLKTDFTLHSNAELLVEGENGTKLGLGAFGGVEESIPTGTFLDVAGIQYASIRNFSAPLNVIVNGTGEGEFTLDVRFSGMKNLTFSYNRVAVINGTVTRLALSPSSLAQAPPPLEVTSAGVTMVIQPNNTAPVSEVQSTTDTSKQGGGGIPEFPLQPLAVSVFTALTVATYLLTRRNQRGVQVLDSGPAGARIQPYLTINRETGQDR
ncbi:MAG: hypothetical protein HY296_08405 [Thaumarchaeota archaeon]|nr:hypothetical protein [Nitrososphaerota archaeon]